MVLACLKLCPSTVCGSVCMRILWCEIDQWHVTISLSTGSNAMDMMDSENEDDDIQVMESADASQ